MAKQPTAADIEFDAQLRDIAGSVAQLVASKASREGRPIDYGDYASAAMGLIGSAYNLAKLGGEDGVRGYLGMLRSHADAVDVSVAGV